MLFIFALVLAAAFALTAKSTIKKHPYPWYLAALFVSLFVSLFPFSRTLPEPVTFILDLFRRGALACALWCVVMWTGAFSNGSWLIKRLMPVRGELSIFAAALTLGHNIGYGRTYFVRFFTDASALPLNQLVACILTILLLVIMIPLTILSFPKIRKRMKAKKWKQIQRFAYLFYALLYFHIMLLFIPLAKAGKDGYYFSVIVYTAVFFGYAICRIRKWYFLKKKPSHRREFTSVCFGLFLAVMVLICAVSIPNNTVAEDVDTASSSAESTFAETVEDTSTPSDHSDSNIQVSTSENETVTVASSEDADHSNSSDLTDGTYSGKAYGYDGAVKVTITIENGTITEISASSEESDLWYFEKCEDTVISEILAAQDTDVDTVSGATYSSNGIKKAVLDALKQAGLEE